MNPHCPPVPLPRQQWHNDNPSLYGDCALTRRQLAPSDAQTPRSRYRGSPAFTARCDDVAVLRPSVVLVVSPGHYHHRPQQSQFFRQRPRNQTWVLQVVVEPAIHTQVYNRQVGFGAESSDLFRNGRSLPPRIVIINAHRLSLGAPRDPSALLR